MYRRLITVIIASMLVSCAMRSGQEFDTSYVDQITRGKTTKHEIEKNIGPPQSVSTTKGGEVWTYHSLNMGSYFENMGRLFSGRGHRMDQKELTVTFKGDIVKDFTLTQGDGSGGPPPGVVERLRRGR